MNKQLREEITSKISTTFDCIRDLTELITPDVMKWAEDVLDVIDNEDPDNPSETLHAEDEELATEIVNLADNLRDWSKEIS